MKLYRIVFFVALLIIVLLPPLFYLSKATKNPSEFKTPEGRYVMIEVKASDISPETLSRIKVDDIQKDYNGEENARIVSILRVQPQTFGKISFNGNDYTSIVSEKKDLYVLLRIRYQNVGDSLVMYPTTTMLKVGNRLNFEFSDYFLYAEIININEIK